MSYFKEKSRMKYKFQQEQQTQKKMLRQKNSPNHQLRFDPHRCTTQRGGGGTSCTPSKEFEKLDHKNAIKHEDIGPPHIFSHNPNYPSQKQFEKDCASLIF